MEFAGLSFDVKYLPELDPAFIPLSRFFAAHRALAKTPCAVALHREGGAVSVYETALIAKPGFEAADAAFLERLVKFLLWSRGAWQLGLYGAGAAGQAVAAAYDARGARGADREFMERIYQRPFVLQQGSYLQRPVPSESARPLGRNLKGCRIGFDAGGSDRKVSAVIDGEAVFSEEVVWYPKEHADPDYHYQGIVSAFKSAAAHLPRVDAIGVSSAGVFIDNRCRLASLFIKVSDADFKAKVEDIYLRAAAELGSVPIAVANDGDVTALAGAMGLNAVNVLGIAMGTSQAAGYVDGAGNITGWLNELAFAPVDASPAAPVDEWSGDIGCGVKYFSQDGVIRLAGLAGITLTGASPAEKLAEVQALMAEGDARAAAVYHSLGVQLGHALAFYANFYHIERVLMMGRVMSGAGGDLLLESAGQVLWEEYPECHFLPKAPDEKARRIGQSVAAASL